MTPEPAGGTPQGTRRADNRLLAILQRSLHACGIGPDSLLLVAVSGGADSLCLLHLLTRLPAAVRPRLHVAHLDHGLRGAESVEDAAFVQRLAAEWGVPATVERRRTARSENAARQTRYAFLAAVATQTQAAAVAVAHTADDQAETVLLHLLRGSGITGLGAMAPDTSWPVPGGTGMRVVRPLLAVRREATHHYCRVHGITPREDPSNRSLDFTRNRIRAELVPHLRSYNPRVIEALVRLSDLARDEDRYWSRAVEECWAALAPNAVPGELRLPLGSLRAELPATQRRLIRRAVAVLRQDVPAASVREIEAHHVERLLALLAAPAGKRAILPGGLVAEVEADALVLRTRTRAVHHLPAEPTLIPVPGEIQVGPWRITTRLTLPPTPPAGGPWHAWLDPERLRGPLVIRRRLPGDRYRPAGMGGSRKVQDILVDAHVPRGLRDAVPVVVAGDRIVWLGGFRIAEEVRISENPRPALAVLLDPCQDTAVRLVALRP